MARVNLNLTDVDPWGGETFTLPEEGPYRLRIENMRVQKSAKGNPTLYSEVTVVAQADGSPTPFEGTMIKDWRSLLPEPTCRRRVKALVMAAGGEDALDADGFDTEPLLGAEFIGFLKHESSKDGKYTNARIYQEEPVV